MNQIQDFRISRLNVADTCKYHADTLANIDQAAPEALYIGALVPAYRQAVADLAAVVMIIGLTRKTAGKTSCQCLSRC